MAAKVDSLTDWQIEIRLHSTCSLILDLLHPTRRYFYSFKLNSGFPILLKGLFLCYFWSNIILSTVNIVRSTMAAKSERNTMDRLHNKSLSKLGKIPNLGLARQTFRVDSLQDLRTRGRWFDPRLR